VLRAEYRGLRTRYLINELRGLINELRYLINYRAKVRKRISYRRAKAE